MKIAKVILYATTVVSFVASIAIGRTWLVSGGHDWPSFLLWSALCFLSGASAALLLADRRFESRVSALASKMVERELAHDAEAESGQALLDELAAHGEGFRDQDVSAYVAAKLPNAPEGWSTSLDAAIEYGCVRRVYIGKGNVLYYLERSVYPDREERERIALDRHFEDSTRALLREMETLRRMSGR